MIDSSPDTNRVLINALIAMLCIITLIFSSCSIVQETKHSEPGIIAVRNNSGKPLSIVSLKEVPHESKQSIRVGSVSPVPKGATQVFHRPSPPPPLPKRLMISWEDNTQQRYEKEIQLRSFLSSSMLTIEDTLVFEIGPSGKVNIIKE